MPKSHEEQPLPRSELVLRPEDYTYLWNFLSAIYSSTQARISPSNMADLVAANVNTALRKAQTDDSKESKTAALATLVAGIGAATTDGIYSYCLSSAQARLYTHEGRWLESFTAGAVGVPFRRGNPFSAELASRRAGFFSEEALKMPQNPLTTEWFLALACISGAQAVAGNQNASFGAYDALKAYVA